MELNLRYYDFIGCLGNIAWNNQAVTIPEGSYTASNQCDPSMNTISPSPLSSVSCVSCQNILVETCEYVSDRLASSCSNGENELLLQSVYLEILREVSVN